MLHAAGCLRHARGVSEVVVSIERFAHGIHKGADLSIETKALRETQPGRPRSSEAEVVLQEVLCICTSVLEDVLLWVADGNDLHCPRQEVVFQNLLNETQIALVHILRFVHKDCLPDDVFERPGSIALVQDPLQTQLKVLTRCFLVIVIEQQRVEILNVDVRQTVHFYQPLHLFSDVTIVSEEKRPLLQSRRRLQERACLARPSIGDHGEGLATVHAIYDFSLLLRRKR